MTWHCILFKLLVSQDMHLLLIEPVYEMGSLGKDGWRSVGVASIAPGDHTTENPVTHHGSARITLFEQRRK
jgi:hypothetical protein